MLSSADNQHLQRVHNAINHAAFILREAGIVDGRREATAIALWILGVDNLVYAPRVFSIRELNDFFAAIGARSRHVPLQHITQTMHFRFMTLESRPDVFVVRPETEYMVDQAIAELPATPLRILDLCTGSGAIILALASEHAQVDGIGIDISDKAIDLAQTNAQWLDKGGPYGVDARHPNYVASGQSTVQFIEGDIRDHHLIDSLGRFDVVISNPPYVPAGDVDQAEALHDPHIALYGGGLDGLAMPKYVIDCALAVLNPGGRFYMEHAPTQGEALSDYARQAGFSDVNVHQDMVGRDRWISAVSSS